MNGFELVNLRDRICNRVLLGGAVYRVIRRRQTRFTGRDIIAFALGGMTLFALEMWIDVISCFCR